MSDNNQNDGLTNTDGESGWLLLECEAGGGGQGHFVRLGLPFTRDTNHKYVDDGPTVGNAEAAQTLWNASKELLKLETIPHLDGVDGPSKDATTEQKRDHDYWNVGKAWRDYSGHNRISLTKGNYLHIIGGTYRRVMVGDEQEQLGTEKQPVRLREDINYIMTEREKKYIGTEKERGKLESIVDVHGTLDAKTTVRGDMTERTEVRGGSKFDLVDVQGGAVSSLSVAGGLVDTTSVVGPMLSMTTVLGIMLDTIVAPLQLELNVGGVFSVFAGYRRELVIGSSEEYALTAKLKIVKDETEVHLRKLETAVSSMRTVMIRNDLAVAHQIAATIVKIN